MSLLICMFRVQPIASEKSKQQELKATMYIISIFERREKWITSSMFHSMPSFSYTSGSQLSGGTFRLGLHISIDTNKKIHEKNSHKPPDLMNSSLCLSSQLILNCFMLIIKIITVYIMFVSILLSIFEFMFIGEIGLYFLFLVSLPFFFFVI